MRAEIGVERLSAEARGDAVATLAAAFRDDTMLRILEPDERRRGPVATWFFERIVGYGLRWAEVWATDDRTAVAIWVPPGSGGMTTLRMLRVGFAGLPLHVGLRGTRRMLRAVAALEALHHAVPGPHWYLPAVGTRPGSEGRGLGSALLAVGTDRADLAGVPAYLEATTPENTAFYAKRGFQVTGRQTVGEHTFTGMIRPPAPPAGVTERPPIPSSG